VNIGLVILAGVVADALDGIGIFLSPKSHTRLKSSPLRFRKEFADKAKLMTASIGFWFALRISFCSCNFSAKGAFKSKDAPYVIPSGIVLGLLTGIAV
jgi:hypothetical protein